MARFWPFSACELTGLLICKRQVVGRNNNGVAANHEACSLVAYLIQQPGVRILESAAPKLRVAPESRACEVEASDKGDAECFTLTASRADSKDETTVRLGESVE